MKRVAVALGVTAGVAIGGVALSAAPAFAAPAGSITQVNGVAGPPTGLHDTDVLTVTGTGWPATTNIQLEECAGTSASPPPSQTNCEGNTNDASGTTDTSGNYLDSPSDPSGATAGFLFHVIPDATIPVSGITCDGTHLCTLYMGTNPGDFSQPHVFVDFTVAGSGPPLPESPLTPLLPASGAAVLLGGAFIIYRKRHVSARAAA